MTTKSTMSTMSTISNDLVPPLKLCKKIPEGAFANSCFVRPDQVCGDPIWTRGTRHYYRMDACGIKMFPAPTLQEILAEFHNFHLEKFGKDNPCSIIAKRDPENFSPYFANHSPVVAALKLYLNLLSDQSDQSDPSVPSDKSVNPPEAQP